MKKLSLILLLLLVLVVGGCSGKESSDAPEPKADIAGDSAVKVDESSGRMSVKVGSDNVGYVYLPNVEIGQVELKDDKSLALKYLSCGYSKDSEFGQSVVKYEGDALFSDTQIRVSCLGSIEYVDKLFSDEGITEIKEKMVVLNEYACVEYHSDDDVTTKTTQRNNGDYYVCQERYLETADSTEHTIIRLLQDNGTYYTVTVSGWLSNKMTRGGDPVTFDALMSIAQSWEPSGRNIHIGVFGTSGLQEYATDIDGVTADGDFVLTNYATKALYTSNILDLNVTDVLQTVHGLAQRSFNLDEDGKTKCTVRQSIDYDGKVAEEEHYFIEEYKVERCAMGTCSVNVSGIDGLTKLLIKYDNCDFMLEIITEDLDRQVESVNNFIKKLEITKVCDL